jgi:thiamine biosynthesis lipoprotein
LPAGRPDDIDIGRGHARLCRPVRITLDGIAKGYAIDLAVKVMRLAGTRSGWINAGGDLRVFGDKLLQVHRREADGALTPLGGLREAALASSRVGGDPDGAFPACIVGADDAAAEVVSVVARSAWRADALTKVAALAPRGERAAAVARLGGHWVEPPALRMAA